MNAELSALEERVKQLIALSGSLRRENNALRQQVLAANGTNRQLSAQIAEAANRLDRLLTRFPGDDK